MWTMWKQIFVLYTSCCFCQKCFLCQLTKNAEFLGNFDTNLLFDAPFEFSSLSLTLLSLWRSTGYSTIASSQLSLNKERERQKLWKYERKYISRNIVFMSVFNCVCEILKYFCEKNEESFEQFSTVLFIDD